MNTNEITFTLADAGITFEDVLDARTIKNVAISNGMTLNDVLKLILNKEQTVSIITKEVRERRPKDKNLTSDILQYLSQHPESRPIQISNALGKKAQSVYAWLKRNQSTLSVTLDGKYSLQNA